MKRYDWVEAKEIVKFLFTEGDADYVVPWFQGAWDVLMFGKPRIKIESVTSQLSESDKADILLWLIALYDVFYDYQSVIGDVEGAGEYEVSREDGYVLKAYNAKDLGERIKRVPQWELFLSEFVKEKIFRSLLERKELNLEQDRCYDSEDNTPKQVDYFENLIQYTVDNLLSEEILRRRNMVIQSILSSFEYDSQRILFFLAGYYARNHYTKYHSKLRQINFWKERTRNEMENRGKVSVEELADIEHQYSQKIEELEEEFPASIPNLQKRIEQYGYKSEIRRVINWIEEGMQPII